jgi:hypothetical protein
LTADRCLQALVGLPLWAVGRAGSLVWFQFGARRTVTDRKGEQREVGAYALHVDCPWRLIDEAGTEHANEDSDEWRFEALERQRPVVERALGTAQHGVVIHFKGGWALQVSPDDTGDDEAVEYWRLFEPYQDRPHLIARSNGVDLEG